MIISQETDKLFEALSNFQSQIETAKKDKQGHGYMYADLAGCIETAKEPLEKNGLAVAQMIGIHGAENTLITILTHSSGQYLGSEFIMEKAVLHGGASKNPAQAMGASITYMRRYAYAAILGIAQEDNDASGRKKASPQTRSQAPAQRKAPEPKQEPVITEAQRKRLMVAYKGVPDITRKAHASNLINRKISSFNDLTKKEAAHIIDRAEQAEQRKHEHS